MRLSAHDASFLYTETANGPMHSVNIALLDGPATYREILEFYRSRLHMVPRLRQKLAYVPFNLAHPVWIDDPDFDIEYHMRAHLLPEGATFDEAIAAALEIAEPLMDRSKPLWRVHVMENVEGKTVLAQQLHHAFVDGATFVAMSIALTTQSPDETAPPAPEWHPRPEPDSFTLWQKAARDQADAAMQAMTKAAEIPALLSSATGLISRMAEPVVMAPWNRGIVGPKRQLATFNTTLADIKTIRKKYGGTVNDVVVTSVSEGISKYLAAHGEKADNQYLRFMCPVNVRDKDVDPMDLEGNRVSAMFPRLSAKSLGAESRHEEVLKEMGGIKARGEPEILDRLQQAQPPVPPVAMAATQTVGTPFDWTAIAAQLPLPIIPNIGLRPQQAGFNCTLTNIPGPPWTQYVAGYPVTQSIGTLMLGGNLGLGIAMGSFDGKIVFNFTCDPRLVSDLEALRDEVKDVFDELLALSSSS